MSAAHLCQGGGGERVGVPRMPASLVQESGDGRTARYQAYQH
jgi:hypothetical protein